MKIFLVLICSLALACVAGGAQEEKKENKPAPKRKGGPAGQVSQPAGKTYGKPTGPGKPATARGPTKGFGPEYGKTRKTEVGKPTGAVKPAEVGKVKGAGKPVAAGGLGGKPFKPQHFNLPSKSKPSKSVAPAVTFQQNRRIEGSDRWTGSSYQAFRNYRSEWHDRNWWRHNHSRIVFVFGGPYYWNSGYWYPAWGYDSNAYYAYDGPIYGYNDLPPDQVIANVQATLQQQGYYQGEVDGLLGPQTRAAIADYQRDRGLYITSAIDQPTLESLGMT
jgi:hypothetical protein